MINLKWLATAVFVLASVTVDLSLGQERKAADAKSPTQAEITESRAPVYTGQISAFSPQGVTVIVGGQSKVVPLDEILNAKFSHGTAQSAANAIIIELNDGSTLRASQITGEGKGVSVQFPSGQAPVAIPTANVSSVQLRPLDGALATQWEAIVNSRISGDTLVLQRSSEALDKIEGVITQVTDTIVKFQFDGQTVDVQRNRLAGWRYYSSAANEKGKLLAVARDLSGSSWMIQSIQGDLTRPDANVELKMVCGAVVSLPILQLSDIDFSYGSMRFLANLQPLERKSSSRLALAVNLPEMEKLFGPRISSTVSTRGATAGPGLEFMGAGELVYRVPDEFRRLMGSVALEPDGPQSVPCKVQISIEDKVVWEKTLETPHESFPIEVAVESGKRIRLQVLVDAKLAAGDLVRWHQLRFVK